MSIKEEIIALKKKAEKIRQIKEDLLKEIEQWKQEDGRK